MSANLYNSLVDKLELLPVFDSSYDTRLLGALITATSPQTASDLSHRLSIPDSKVYPTLNKLEEIGIITVNDQSRPKTYYFDKPELLQTFLLNYIEQQHEFNREIIGNITTLTKQIWQPEEFLLDNVALLFRGSEIRNELARHVKLTKNNLFIFLSTNFSEYYDLLREYIPTVSHDNFRLQLVIPPGHEKLLTHLERHVKGKILVRTSIWNQNSYIIRDRGVMMNMFHSDQDVALLTNDELMVKNVENCWNDPDCCTSTDLVELELPDNFNFSTIELR